MQLLANQLVTVNIGNIATAMSGPENLELPDPWPFQMKGSDQNESIENNADYYAPETGEANLEYGDEMEPDDSKA